MLKQCIRYHRLMKYFLLLYLIFILIWRHFPHKMLNIRKCSCNVWKKWLNFHFKWFIQWILDRVVELHYLIFPENCSLGQCRLKTTTCSITILQHTFTVRASYINFCFHLVLTVFRKSVMSDCGVNWRSRSVANLSEFILWNG